MVVCISLTDIEIISWTDAGFQYFLKWSSSRTISWNRSGQCLDGRKIEDRSNRSDTVYLNSIVSEKRNTSYPTHKVIEIPSCLSPSSSSSMTREVQPTQVTVDPMDATRPNTEELQIKQAFIADLTSHTEKNKFLTQEQWRNMFMETFFQGKSLERIMAHFSNTCSAAYVDPVTTTVTMMLKNPVQCAINEQGICPFKAYPTMTFPFSLMDSKQQAFLNDIQQAENRNVVSIHYLMGGGRMHLFYESFPPHYIQHTDALVEICNAALSHPTYAVEQRLQVCNIVMQRVAALVNISNSTLKQVNVRLRSRIVDVQKTTIPV